MDGQGRDVSPGVHERDSVVAAAAVESQTLDRHGEVGHRDLVVAAAAVDGGAGQRCGEVDRLAARGHLRARGRDGVVAGGAVNDQAV